MFKNVLKNLMIKKMNLFVLGIGFLGFYLALLTGSGSYESEHPTSHNTPEVEKQPTHSRSWGTDFSEGQKKATQEGKMLLVDFSGSDWCHWCIKLDEEVFAQKEFQQYAKDNLVLVSVDFPRKKIISIEQKQKNNLLAKKFGIEGFPTVLIFSSKGELLQRTGYRKGGPKNYVDYIKSLTAKGK